MAAAQLAQDHVREPVAQEHQFSPVSRPISIRNLVGQAVLQDLLVVAQALHRHRLGAAGRRNVALPGSGSGVTSFSASRSNASSSALPRPVIPV